MNKSNTGVGNSGDWNSGDLNSGHWNSGHWNSGDLNRGDMNSGKRNSGDFNSGHLNSGDLNSGSWNSGNRNSGHLNSGDYNSGDYNSGDHNSGYHNSGYLNSGDWNSGNRNSGYFNTNSPDKIRIFNTWVDMTHEEFNEKYNVYADIPLNRWIEESDMSEQELKDFPKAKQMGGYLKTLPFKEACQIWWKENPDRHQDFLALPSFNPEIFKEITGIDTAAEQPMTDDELIAELERRGKVVEGKIIK